jgi:hypothetical protein
MLGPPVAIQAVGGPTYVHDGTNRSSTAIGRERLIPALSGSERSTRCSLVSMGRTDTAQLTVRFSFSFSFFVFSFDFFSSISEVLTISNIFGN